MVGVLRTLLATLLMSLLLSGVSLTKVVCVHLDTKVAHVEAVEILDQGNEIHFSVDSFLPPEAGKVKIFSEPETPRHRHYLADQINGLINPSDLNFSWKQPMLLRTVRLVT